MRWLFSIIVFALDVWAIASIINTDASNKSKILWILLILPASVPLVVGDFPVLHATGSCSQT